MTVPQSRSLEPVYGYNAVRLPLWFAGSCDSTARGIARGWWKHVFSKQSAAGSLPLSLFPTPVALISVSATASAAGDQNTAAALRRKATTETRKSPTYCGDAWVALGDALSRGLINSCAP
ncbi:MAG: hypothetical protein WB770_07395 [Acidimicrobiales bacterium]